MVLGNWRKTFRKGDGQIMKTALEKLADHVERFNCSVYVDGRLMLFPDFPVAGNRRRGIHVGRVDKTGPMDWQIKSLESDAPSYLKPLIGESFAGQNLLKSAVRKAAFVAEFEAVCEC